MSKRESFKRPVDEGREGAYANMKNDGDRFGKEAIVKGGEMRVKNGAKVSLCGDEDGGKDVFAITDDTSLTGGGKRSGRGKGD